MKNRIIVLLTLVILFVSFSPFLLAQTDTVSIFGGSLEEGDAGQTLLTFRIVLSDTSSGDVTVNLQSDDLNATGSEDYQLVNTTVTIPAGLRNTDTVPFAVSIIGDVTFEEDDTFRLTLSFPTALGGEPVIVSPTDGSAFGIIENDDALPILTISDESVLEGAPGIGATLDFEVSLSNPSFQSIIVPYTFMDGTAIGGTDYGSTPGSITINSGDLDVTISIPIIGDADIEGDESFNIVLNPDPVDIDLIGSDTIGIGIIIDDNSPAILSVSDVNISEGNTGSSPIISFDIVLNFSVPNNIVLPYTFTDISAVNATDYIGTNSTVTILAGNTTTTVTATVIGDLDIEPNETFSLTVSPPLTGDINLTSSDTVGIATIIDDDIASILSVGDIGIVEGNTGSTQITFSISLSSPRGNDIVLPYAFTDIGAINGVDYNGIDASVTISAGNTMTTVTATVSGDLSVEPDETFRLTLSPPSIDGINLGSSDTVAIVTILNDDVPSVLSINDVNITEGNVGVSNIVFIVSLTTPLAFDLNLPYTFRDFNATNGVDYVGVNNTVTIPSGSLLNTIRATVSGDLGVEANETFDLTISPPLTGDINLAASDTVGIATIIDDDAASILSVSDVSITEGNVGSPNVTFNILLSSPRGNDITLPYSFADITATNGVDYNGVDGSVTITAGNTMTTVTATVTGDLTIESSETFSLTVSPPSTGDINLTSSDTIGVATIINDDMASILSIGNLTLNEGNAGVQNITFDIELNTPRGVDIILPYVFADITATNGVDYNGVDGSVTLTAGNTMATVTAAITGDLLVEPNETFSLTISPPSTGDINLTSSDTVGIATIVNDDVASILSISDASVNEGNAGIQNITFNIELNAPRGVDITLPYTFADISATNGLDYNGTDGSVVITAGNLTAAITADVAGDLLVEPNETFSLTISPPLTGEINLTSSDTVGIGTIVSDDIASILSVSDASINEGNAGTQNITFNIELNAPRGANITLPYTFTDITATNGLDYNGTDGSATILAGNLMTTVTANVVGDLEIEGNETFSLTVSPPLTGDINLTSSDTVGIATILSDDIASILSVSDASIIEGNTGTPNITFDIELNTPRGVDITLPYTFTDITATNGVDYNGTNGSVTILAGNLMTTVTATVTGDRDIEPNETFSLTVSPPSIGDINLTSSDTVGIATIVDDDGPSILSVSDVNVVEGNIGNPTVTFDIELLTPVGVDITLPYIFTGLTATNGMDYDTTPGNITILAGNLKSTISTTIVADISVESNETFSVTVSPPSGGEINLVSSDTVGIATIVDDDATTILSVDDIVVDEGNIIGGSTVISFNVILNTAAADELILPYTFTDITAVNGDDYTVVSTTGMVTIASGNLSATVTALIIGDIDIESDETFSIAISLPMNGQINFVASDTIAIATIVNDDIASILSVDDFTTTEGSPGLLTNVSFNVSLDIPVATDLVLPYTFVDITATNGDDYNATSGTLTIIAGNTTGTINASILGDFVVEPNEFFRLIVSPPLTGEINLIASDTIGVVTIVNDDVASILSVADLTVTEGDAGLLQNISFNVILSSPSVDLILPYTFTDMTATGGDDYNAVSGTLIITSGNTTGTINASIVGDFRVEPDETFSLTISPPLTGAINLASSDTVSIATIVNDDLFSVFSISDVTVNEEDVGLTNMVFTLNQNGSSGDTVTVDYTTVDGSATTADNDYISKSGTFTILPTTQTTTSTNVTVQLVGDNRFERTDTFSLAFSNLVNGTFLNMDSVVLGIITNDDPMPTISVSDVSVSESNTGNTNVISFNLLLSNPSIDTIEVDYTTKDGTATLADNDYVELTPSIIRFDPDMTGGVVTTSVIGDDKFEADQVFNFVISNPVNSFITDSIATGTILNDDARPTITILDTSTFELDAGSSALTFSIILSNQSDEIVSVNYLTEDNTATVSDNDYVSINNSTIIFQPADTFETLTVDVIGDNKFEDDDILNIRLFDFINASLITKERAIGTILNDDPLPTANLVSDRDSISEASEELATFTVTLDRASYLPTMFKLTFDFQGDGGLDIDYTLASGINSPSGNQIIIPEDDLLGSINVSAIPDLVFEPNGEVLTVTLSEPINAIIGNDSIADLLIVNDLDVDSDGDGLSNAEELTLILSTDPGNPDSDGDGINDGVEVGGDVLNPINSDDDALINALDSDDDNDLILTINEDFNNDSNPLNDDNDQDGLSNYLDLDSDNDGIPDIEEGVFDVDGDRFTNYVDLDSDGDGLSDLIEGGGNDFNGDATVDNYIDFNNNGFTVQYDPTEDGTPLPLPDQDDDNIPDYLDIDESNNGLGFDTNGDNIADLVFYEGLSPNGDNINDTWIIDGINAYVENRVRIYNRWGQLVYEQKGYDSNQRVFEGKSNMGSLENGDLPDGIYYFVVQLGTNLPSEFGTLIIKR